MNPICKYCDQEKTDVNEGYYRLRFGPPAWECQTPGCPGNPYTEVVKDAPEKLLDENSQTVHGGR